LMVFQVAFSIPNGAHTTVSDPRTRLQQLSDTL
jgi:hypothetical protein